MSRHTHTSLTSDSAEPGDVDAPTGANPSAVDGPSRPRRRRVIIVVAAAVLAAALVIAFLMWPREVEKQAAPEPVPATVPVELSAEGVPAGVSIGILVTLGDSANPGSEWNQAAQGAVVAQYRFELGKTNIKLVTQDDRGTPTGAERAVERLQAQGVSGIVIASSGEQAAAAAQAAENAGIPAILPYANPDKKLKNVWSTAPSAVDTSAALKTALKGKARTLVVDAGTGSPAGVKAARTIRFQPGDDIEEIAKDIAIGTGDRLPDLPRDAPKEAKATPTKNPVDAVVLSATPARQALFVKALQAQNLSVPIVMTPTAITPIFAKKLEENDGATSGLLISVAAAWGDSVALQQDGSGRAMSAFLGGLRLASSEKKLMNLSADVPFATVAWAADSRSHDAVVALVRAISDAKSADPAKVARALDRLVLGPSDGLAGPAVDFGSADTLADKPVPVYASSQDLGLRPTDGTAPSLVWIPAAEQTQQ